MSKKILKADFVFGYVIRDVNLLYWNKRIAVMKKGKKMERYKVILVDDEAEVIDMIEKKIHWNDLGFEDGRKCDKWGKSTGISRKTPAGCGADGY